MIKNVKKPNLTYPILSGFDMQVMQFTSDVELIAYLGQKVNEVIDALNNNTIALEQAQEAINAMEQQWENVKDTFPEQIQSSVNEYFSSEEFKNALNTNVENTINSSLPGVVDNALEPINTSINAINGRLSSVESNASDLSQSIQGLNAKIDANQTPTPEVTMGLVDDLGLKWRDIKSRLDGSDQRNRYHGVFDFKPAFTSGKMYKYTSSNMNEMESVTASSTFNSCEWQPMPKSGIGIVMEQIGFTPSISWRCMFAKQNSSGDYVPAEDYVGANVSLPVESFTSSGGAYFPYADGVYFSLTANTTAYERVHIYVSDERETVNTVGYSRNLNMTLGSGSSNYFSVYSTNMGTGNYTKNSYGEGIVLPCSMVKNISCDPMFTIVASLLVNKPNDGANGSYLPVVITSANGIQEGLNIIDLSEYNDSDYYFFIGIVPNMSVVEGSITPRVNYCFADYLKQDIYSKVHIEWINESISHDAHRSMASNMLAANYEWMTNNLATSLPYEFVNVSNDTTYTLMAETKVKMPPYGGNFVGSMIGYSTSVPNYIKSLQNADSAAYSGWSNGGYGLQCSSLTCALLGMKYPFGVSEWVNGNFDIHPFVPSSVLTEMPSLEDMKSANAFTIDDVQPGDILINILESGSGHCMPVVDVQRRAGRLDRWVVLDQSLPYGITSSFYFHTMGDEKHDGNRPFSFDSWNNLTQYDYVVRPTDNMLGDIRANEAFTTDHGIVPNKNIMCYEGVQFAAWSGDVEFDISVNGYSSFRLYNTTMTVDRTVTLSAYPSKEGRESGFKIYSVVQNLPAGIYYMSVDDANFAYLHVYDLPSISITDKGENYTVTGIPDDALCIRGEYTNGLNQRWFAPSSTISIPKNNSLKGVWNFTNGEATEIIASQPLTSIYVLLNDDGCGRWVKYSPNGDVALSGGSVYAEQ